MPSAHGGERYATGATRVVTATLGTPSLTTPDTCVTAFTTAFAGAATSPPHHRWTADAPRPWRIRCPRVRPPG